MKNLTNNLNNISTFRASLCTVAETLNDIKRERQARELAIDNLKEKIAGIFVEKYIVPSKHESVFASVIRRAFTIAEPSITKMKYQDEEAVGVELYSLRDLDFKNAEGGNYFSITCRTEKDCVAVTCALVNTRDASEVKQFVFDEAGVVTEDLTDQDVMKAWYGARAIFGRKFEAFFLTDFERTVNSENIKGLKVDVFKQMRGGVDVDACRVLFSFPE